MVKGFMNGNVPFIIVSVLNGNNLLDIQFTLDTGFTEDLLVTHEIASELELDAENFSELYVANGEKVTLNFSNANAIMENENKKVQILVSNGIPLLGIGFLTKFGYKAIIDCKQRTVTLEK